MRLFYAIAVSLSVVAAIAMSCGGSSSKTAEDPTRTAEGAPTSQTATEPIERAELTEDVLRGALTTLEDLPTGWAGGETAIDSDAPDPCGLRAAYQVGSVARVRAEFEDDGSGIVSLVVGYESSNSASAALDELRTAIGMCSEVEENIEGQDVVIDAAPLSFPTYGEEMVAFRQTVETDFQQFNLEAVFLRHDNVVAATVFDGFFIDTAELEDLVRVSDQRVRGLVAEDSR